MALSKTAKWMILGGVILLLFIIFWGIDPFCWFHDCYPVPYNWLQAPTYEQPIKLSSSNIYISLSEKTWISVWVMNKFEESLEIPRSFRIQCLAQTKEGVSNIVDMPLVSLTDTTMITPESVTGFYIGLYLSPEIKFKGFLLDKPNSCKFEVIKDNTVQYSTSFIIIPTTGHENRPRFVPNYERFLSQDNIVPITS